MQIDFDQDETGKIKDFVRFVSDAHWVDFRIRKDGRDIIQEGDWVKNILRRIAKNL